MNLIFNFNRILKYTFALHFFLAFNSDIYIFEYNFPRFQIHCDELLELIESDEISSIIKLDEEIFKKNFIEFRKKIISLIDLINKNKNILIKEIENNLYDKINYLLCDLPIHSLLQDVLITTETPIDYIISAIKSNDFSFYNLMNDKRFIAYSSTSSFQSDNQMLKNDLFVIRIYSSIYFGFITEYLRTGKILDKFHGFSGFTELQLKSFICCLQKAISRNKNVDNGQIVYRAIRKFRFPYAIKVGDKFYFREFISTSTQKSFSMNWLQGCGIFLIITITNNGTNGHSNYCYYIENITCYKNQYEVLFHLIAILL